MKTRTLASIMILVLAVLIIAGSCATGKKAYVAQEDEELYGTWVNKEYNDWHYHAKHVINADGTIFLYPTDNSPRLIEEDKYIITDKWHDSEGNIWYKAIITYQVQKSIEKTTPTYVLAKISNSGNILETVKSGVDYPTELSPDALQYKYEILYRQE